MSEHAEIASKFVGNGESFKSRRFCQGSGRGLNCGAIENIKTLSEDRKMALPEFGKERFNLSVFSIVVLGHCNYWV